MKHFFYSVTTFKVDGKEIIPLFDAPHMTKGIRNNLLNKNLKFVAEVEGKQVNMMARWEDIQTSYILHKYAPKDVSKDDNKKEKKWKLSSAHVYENEMSKMKVKIASEVLSNTVSEYLVEASMKNKSTF